MRGQAGPLTLAPAGGSTALVLRGIDASREERFERRIDARPAERTFDQRVEAECRKVALVEHDRMPQIDRPRVVRLVRYEIEQPLRPRAVARIPIRDECGVRHTASDGGGRPLEGAAIPAGERGGAIVRAVDECLDLGRRIRRRAHGFVRQDELAHLAMVIRG